MIIDDVPELDGVPPEQREVLLQEAVRRVNTTHGRMGNGPHYVGCILVALIAGPLAIMEKGYLIGIAAAVPAYFASQLVGVVLWRRSMHRELRRLVQQLATTQTKK
jgi:hypothetical protein